MRMPPFTNEHASVRYLDLRGLTSTNHHHCYNEQQCLNLIRSPLGNQCEYLQIEVEKRNNILDLVKKMPKLRTLNVRCRDRKPNDQELIKWLRDRLPSSCSLAKDSPSSNDIRLWLR